MSWKPELLVQGKWYRNGLTFETQEEAKQNAFDKFMAWTQAEGSRAVEVDSRDFPPTHAYLDGVLSAFE